MDEQKFCQSCGMPLDKKEFFGTSTDKTQNEEYCIYCFKDGKFTMDVTIDEMIDISLKHMNELFKNDSNYNEKAALEKMRSFFPLLKRWKA